MRIEHIVALAFPTAAFKEGGILFLFLRYVVQHVLADCKADSKSRHTPEILESTEDSSQGAEN